MNRRSFIKGLMALASAPAIGKYVNVFKTEGAREGIEQVASKGVDFFNSVIRKVMDEGTLIREEDRIKTFTHPERSDVMVDVNMGDGTTSVYFDTDEGTRAMGQIGKTADDTTKGRTVEELYEAEEIYGPYGKEEQEGIAGGISNLEKFVKKKYADGGRVGFKSGKFVKDGIAALLKLGKGQLKTADEIEPSEFSKFNERNRKLTDEEYEDLVAEYGEGVPQLETVADAERFVQGQKDYEAAMFVDYKAGRLDPKPGEPGRKRYLEKKAEEAEMSGDSRLFTPDEADELTSMQKFGGPKTDDYYQKSLDVENALDAKRYGGIENANIPVEMMSADVIKAKYPGVPDEMAEMIANLPNDKKALALADLDQALMLMKTGRSSDEVIEIMKREPETKMADGGPVTEDVSLTVIKIPDISESGVESLFKRR